MLRHHFMIWLGCAIAFVLGVIKSAGVGELQVAFRCIHALTKQPLTSLPVQIAPNSSSPHLVRTDEEGVLPCRLSDLLPSFPTELSGEGTLWLDDVALLPVGQRVLDYNGSPLKGISCYLVGAKPIQVDAHLEEGGKRQHFSVTMPSETFVRSLRFPSNPFPPFEPFSCTQTHFDGTRSQLVWVKQAVMRWVVGYDWRSPPFQLPHRPLTLIAVGGYFSPNERAMQFEFTFRGKVVRSDGKALNQGRLFVNGAEVPLKDDSSFEGKAVVFVGRDISARWRSFPLLTCVAYDADGNLAWGEWNAKNLNNITLNLQPVPTTALIVCSCTGAMPAVKTPEVEVKKVTLKGRPLFLRLPSWHATMETTAVSFLLPAESEAQVLVHRRHFLTVRAGKKHTFIVHDRPMVVTGKALRSEGEPLQGVSVGNIVTDSDGQFTATIPYSGVVNLEIKPPETYWQFRPVKAGQNEVRAYWVLKLKAEPCRLIRLSPLRLSPPAMLVIRLDPMPGSSDMPRSVLITVKIVSPSLSVTAQILDHEAESQQTIPLQQVFERDLTIWQPQPSEPVVLKGFAGEWEIALKAERMALVWWIWDWDIIVPSSKPNWAPVYEPVGTLRLSLAPNEVRTIVWHVPRLPDDPPPREPPGPYLWEVLRRKDIRRKKP